MNHRALDPALSAPRRGPTDCGRSPSSAVELNCIGPADDPGVFIVTDRGDMFALNPAAIHMAHEVGADGRPRPDLAGAPRIARRKGECVARDRVRTDALLNDGRIDLTAASRVAACLGDGSDSRASGSSRACRAGESGRTDTNSPHETPCTCRRPSRPTGSRGGRAGPGATGAAPPCPGHPARAASASSGRSASWPRPRAISRKRLAEILHGY